VRNVLWHTTQFDLLADDVTARIPIDPVPADSCKPRATPHHSIIRLAVAVRAAGKC
jgi:hypothetical protein